MNDQSTSPEPNRPHEKDNPEWILIVALVLLIMIGLIIYINRAASLQTNHTSASVVPEVTTAEIMSRLSE